MRRSPLRTFERNMTSSSLVLLFGPATKPVFPLCRGEDKPKALTNPISAKWHHWAGLAIAFITEFHRFVILRGLPPHGAICRYANA